MKRMKNNRSLFPVVIVLLAAMILSGTYTLAKYISTNVSDTSVTPQSFYFESDLLSLEGATYTVNGDTVAFELRNYADSLRFSETDITYEITLEKGGEKQDLTGINGATVDATAIKATGTITAGANQETTVKINNLGVGTYTVTAKATSPYSKTLTANFVLQEEDLDVKSTYIDGGNVVYLTLTTTDYEGTVTVSWTDTNLSPDNTNPNATNITSSSLQTTLNANSSYTFVFFKTDASIPHEETNLFTVEKN